MRVRGFWPLCGDRAITLPISFADWINPPTQGGGEGLRDDHGGGGGGNGGSRSHRGRSRGRGHGTGHNQDQGNTVPFQMIRHPSVTVTLCIILTHRQFGL